MSDNPTRLGERVDAVADQFEAAWKAVQPPHVTAFVADAAGPERAALLAELREIDRLYRARFVDGANAADTVTTSATRSADAAPALPTIPGYTVEAELGRGGMSVVYLARHVALKRPVALKVLRAGADAGGRQRQRFRAEAEAAARLQHPHIAQVYEVGEHDGQLYLALEYVAGGSLARRLAGKPLPARAAAELVETLARAMHHAHRQGIVHRDLKPANILLQTDKEPGKPGDREGEGLKDRDVLTVSWSPGLPGSLTPKIADFGLAKLLDADAGQTRTGEIVGTPEYMAPEQTYSGPQREGQGAVSPLVDVYGLGVILYECLTGRPPFQGETFLDTLALVRTEEPIPPHRLRPGIPRDLETICLKALAKQPGRRYADAEALADDLRRFLDGRPIVARPVGRGEKAWRWCRRNPWVAGFAAASTLFLVGMTATSVWAAVAAFRIAASKEAEAQAKRAAERNLQHALDTVEIYLTRVNESRELLTFGLQPLRRDLLESAGEFYRRFIADEGEQSSLRVPLAKAHYQLGRISTEISTRDEALQHFQKALNLFTALLREDPAHPDYRSNTAGIHLAIGQLHRQAGKTREAETELKTSHTICEELAREYPSYLGYQRSLAQSSIFLGGLYRSVDRSQEAEVALKVGVRVLDALAKAEPTSVPAQLDLANGMLTLGVFYRNSRRFQQARNLYQDAASLVDLLIQRLPDDPAIRSLGLRTYSNLGRMLVTDLQLPSEALAAQQRALEMGRKLLRRHPLVHEYQHVTGVSLGELATLYLNQGSMGPAKEHFHESLKLLEGAVEVEPTILEYRRSLGVTLARTATFYRDTGELETALGWYTRAILMLESIVERQSNHAIARQFRVLMLREKAGVLDQLGRHIEALKEWDRAVEVKDKANEFISELDRALSYARLGAHEKATHEAYIALKNKVDGDVVRGVRPQMGNHFYSAARVYSVASLAARDDSKLSLTERESLTEQHATYAVDLLWAAKELGYFRHADHRAGFKKDTCFTHLESRRDFSRLLSTLDNE